MKLGKEDELLDALLAQPTQISDRGFCRETLRLIEQPTIRKTKIFSLAGLSWLFLAVVFGSPANLSQQLRSMEETARTFLLEPLSRSELTQLSLLNISIDITVPAFALALSLAAFVLIGPREI